MMCYGFVEKQYIKLVTYIHLQMFAWRSPKSGVELVSSL